jgi:hypothetical protein
LDGIRAVACRNRMQRSRGGVDLDQGVRKSAKAGPGSGTWSTGLGLLDLGCWTWPAGLGFPREYTAQKYRSRERRHEIRHLL